MRRSSSETNISRESMQADVRLRTQIPRTSFFCLHGRFYLALFGVEQAEKISRHELGSNYVLITYQQTIAEAIIIDDENTGLSSLEEIYKFDLMLQAKMRQNRGAKFVICTGAQESCQLKTAFLLGCYMIMSLGLTPKETADLFQPIRRRFDDSKLGGAMLSSWTALHEARCMGWVNFQETFDLGSDGRFAIEMDEYMHYARCLSLQTRKGYMRTYFRTLTATHQNGSISSSKYPNYWRRKICKYAQP